jgi:hypothetical protein
VFFLFTYRKEESIEGFAEFRLNSPRIPDWHNSWDYYWRVPTLASQGPRNTHFNGDRIWFEGMQNGSKKIV